MGDSKKSKPLNCKIINIEPDPKHPNRTIVSLQIDDGDKMRGPYIRAYSLIPPEYPITLEKFAIDLAGRDLSRPDKPFHYLEEAREAQTEFVINPTDRGSDEEDNVVT